jgi:hypothetical protein
VDGHQKDWTNKKLATTPCIINCCIELTCEYSFGIFTGSWKFANLVA